MTDTTHITRGTSLGSCPHCHRTLTATAEYLIGSVQGSDNVPPDTKGPITPVGMIANLTLTGLRIEHSCGSAVKPQGVMRGGVQPGVITSNHFVSGDPAEVADEVRQRAARAAEVGVRSGAR